MAFAHSRYTSCAAPRCTPQIGRGDLFGVQCRYKPSPNILIAYSGNTSQKVEIMSFVFMLCSNYQECPSLVQSGFGCWTSITGVDSCCYCFFVLSVHEFCRKKETEVLL